MISKSAIPIYLRDRFKNDIDFNNEIETYCENFGYFANYGYDGDDILSYILFFVNTNNEHNSEEQILDIEFAVKRKIIKDMPDISPDGHDNTIKFADDIINTIIEKVEDFLKEGVEYEGKIYSGFSILDKHSLRALPREDETQIITSIRLVIDIKRCKGA